MTRNLLLQQGVATDMLHAIFGDAVGEVVDALLVRGKSTPSSPRRRLGNV